METQRTNQEIDTEHLLCAKHPYQRLGPQRGQNKAESSTFLGQGRRTGSVEKPRHVTEGTSARGPTHSGVTTVRINVLCISKWLEERFLKWSHHKEILHV